MTDETIDKTAQEPEAAAETVEETTDTAAEEPEPAAEEPEAKPEAEPEAEAEEAEAVAEEPEAEPEEAPEPAEEETEAEPAEEPEPAVDEATEAEPEEASEPAEEAPAADEEQTEAALEEGEAAAEPEPVVEKIPGMNWYVLRVQSNKEDSVRENLEKRVKAAGLDREIARVLVPTEKISEIKSGKKRVTERKVYPGYVMVEMVMTDDTWYLVRETPGIGDFVGGAPNTKPVPMPQYEVDKILGEAEKVDEDQPKLDIKFREGEAVKITEGPFENFSGVVQEVIPQKGLVKVEVTIFGRPTPVELEYWQIESI